MTIFDQRGQTVTYQSNIAGDLNLGAEPVHSLEPQKAQTRWEPHPVGCHIKVIAKHPRTGQ